MIVIVLIPCLNTSGVAARLGASSPPKSEVGSKRSSERGILLYTKSKAATITGRGFTIFVQLKHY